jgi:hypothetical protein
MSQSPSVCAKAALIREGLSGRRVAPAPGQEVRLAKTLVRLEPAALLAMACVDGSEVESAPGFPSVLRQLSHA